VDAGDLAIDDQALESLSNPTEVGLAVVQEPELPAPPTRVVYRDRDGAIPPQEVRESLAQLSDPEPAPPRDDPSASTDHLLGGLQLIPPGAASLEKDNIEEDKIEEDKIEEDNLEEEPQEEEPQEEEPLEAENPEELEGGELKAAASDAALEPLGDPNELGPDQALEPVLDPSEVDKDSPLGDLPEDWAGELNAVGEDFSLDDPKEPDSSPLVLQEPVIADSFSAAAERIPEDTNFDQPNAHRFSGATVERLGGTAPDSSTAVIVNYLEDTEDSFFEIEGQSQNLSEEEDMDIDLLDQGAAVGILAAKPMIPVPRKAV
jgi:hypothetical protein